MASFKTYYQLTKPGIIYGNALTAAAGFLLAAGKHVHLLPFVELLLGMALVIASACVYNNYFDRDIDAKMARTKKRALVQGELSGRLALTYGTLLGVAGFTILVQYTNALTVLIGAIAWIDYVIFYTFSKRKTVFSTLIGSISGAAPIVAGYTAAVNRFDGGALLVGIIMVLWQMPHFYAIAIFRRSDYAAADLPVLTVVRGVKQAKYQIVGYIVAFLLATCALTVFGYAGYSYLIVMILLSLSWLLLAVRGFNAGDDVAWARKVFFRSLIVMTGLSVMLALGSILP